MLEARMNFPASFNELTDFYVVILISNQIHNGKRWTTQLLPETEYKIPK